MAIDLTLSLVNTADQLSITEVLEDEDDLDVPNNEDRRVSSHLTARERRTKTNLAEGKITEPEGYGLRRRDKKTGFNIGKWVAAGIASVIGGGIVGVALAPAALTVLGFTGAGVAANSIAAYAMSQIGPIAAGSVYAACQSAGVVGIGVNGGLVAATVGGTVGGAGAAIANKIKNSAK